MKKLRAWKVVNNKLVLREITRQSFVCFDIIVNSFTSFLFIFLSEFSECDVVYINIKVFNRFYSLRYTYVIVNKIFKSFSYQLYSFCRKVLIFVVNIRLGAQQCREETVTSPYLYRLAWNRKDCGITWNLISIFELYLIAGADLMKESYSRHPSIISL